MISGDVTPHVLNSKVSTELTLAYRSTSYVVDTPKGKLIIQIGSASALIDELLADKRTHEWAFLSASNPGSKKLTEKENNGRYEKLRSVLIELEKKFFEGYSRAEDGSWPDEKGALVFDISLTQALETGRRFGQLAIVSGILGEKAELTDCQTGKSF